MARGGSQPSRGLPLKLKDFYGLEWSDYKEYLEEC